VDIIAKYDKAKIKDIFDKSKTKEEFKAEVKKLGVSQNYANVLWKEFSSSSPKQPVERTEETPVQQTPLKPNIDVQTVTASDVKVVESPELKEGKDLQQSYAQMLPGAETPVTPTEPVGVGEGEEGLEVGAEVQAEPSRNIAIDLSVVFSSLIKSIDDNLLFPERKLTDEEKSRIDFRSQEVQETYLPELESENAAVYNLLIEGIISPLVARLDIVVPKVANFFRSLMSRGRPQPKTEAQGEQPIPQNVQVIEEVMKNQPNAPPNPTPVQRIQTANISEQKRAWLMSFVNQNYKVADDFDPEGEVDTIALHDRILQNAGASVLRSL